MPVEKQVLLFALLALLTQGILRISATPLWAHYDEPGHFEYVRYVTELRQLPDRQQPHYALLERIAATQGANTPILIECPPEGYIPCVQVGQQFDELAGYYILQALVQTIFDFESITAQVHLARFISVLLGVAVGWLGYASVRETFPHEPLIAVSVPLVLSTLIGYVDLMSAINNDVGAVVAMSLLIYAMTRIGRYGFNWQRTALVLTAIAICLVTKLTTWIALPIVGIGILLFVWRDLPRWVKGCLIAVIVLGIAGSMIWEPKVGLIVRPTLDQYLPMGGLNTRLKSWYMPSTWLHYAMALRWQFVTFWSGFGTGVAGLSRGPIAWLSALCLVAAVGLIKQGRSNHLMHWQKMILLFYVVVIALAFLVSVMRIDGPEMGGYIPTARHFYVAIIPTMLLFILELRSWVPPKWQRYGLVALILTLYILSVHSLLWTQIPWFMAHTPA